MRYVYTQVAGDWAALWRCPEGGPAEKVWEHHELDICDFASLVERDGSIELEYRYKPEFERFLDRGRIPRGTTLEKVLAAEPPGKCSAHECPNDAVVTYEIERSEGAPDELRFPRYCPVHAAAAETNPTMRLVGVA